GHPPVFLNVSGFALNSIPDGTDVLAFGTLVKSPASSQIYFIDGLAKKIPLNSFAVSSELGITRWQEVSEATLRAYSTAQKPLTSNLVCGATTYVGGSGVLTAVSNANGLPTTALDARTCQALPRTAGVASQFFVKSSGSPELYLVDKGAVRH